ncbi:hypothetical protein [Herbihabitans rhizosphaerae]|uniref:hypothetical protein n=1 Tax=Herbihabitans rhizosphaerae TaxID=1872711 RepID=UPI00102CA8B1|nr:hypothetical protein [Herbihabitans rhizosphaerae]
MKPGVALLIGSLATLLVSSVALVACTDTTDPGQGTPRGGAIEVNNETASRPSTFSTRSSSSSSTTSSSSVPVVPSP